MKRRLIMMFSAVMALASCNKDQSLISPIGTPDAVSFEVNGIRTRVSDGRFDLNDKIFVTAYNDGAFFKSTNYEYEGENTFGSDYPFSYAGETPLSLSYVATYPSKYNKSSFTVVAAADQSDAENYEMSDALVAKTDPTDAVKPSLTFYHVMSNLVVKMNVTNLSNEPIEYSDVKFKAILSQDCDTEDETYDVNAEATAQYVTPLALSEERYSMVLAAGQTLYLKDDFGSVTIDGKEYNMPAETGADVTLKSGFMDKYTWTLQIDGGTVISNKIEKIAGSLNDWDYDGTGGSTGGDTGGDVTPPATGDNLLVTAGWDAGAESADPGWKNFALWTNSGINANGIIVDNTTEQAHGGTKSTKITAPAKGWFVGSYRKDNTNTQILVPVTSGTTYTIGAWFYFTSIPTTPNLSTAIGGAGNQVYGSLAVTTADLNKWVYKSVDVVAKASESCEVIFQALNVANTTDFAFYIDDVSMVANGGSTGGGTVTPPSTGGTNLLSGAGYDTSFEDASKGVYTDLAWGANNENFATTSYTMTNNSTAAAHTGSKSTYFSVVDGGKGFAVGYRTATNMQIPITGLTTGTYTISFWINVSAHSGNANGGPGIGFDYTATGHAADFNEKPSIAWVGAETAPAGTWTQLSVEITVDTTQMDELILRTVNYGTGDFSFYIDDVSMVANGGSTGGGTVTPPSTGGDDLLSATGFDTSFENASTGGFVDLWWGETFGTDKYTLTNNSAAQAHTGSKSTYISVTEAGGCAVAYRKADGSIYSVTGLTTGTYNVNFWVYVTEFQVNDTSTPAIGFEYRMEDQSHKANFDKVGVNYWIGADFAKNTWTQLSVEFTVDTTTMDELILRAVNNGTGDFSFYIDDISLTKK